MRKTLGLGTPNISKFGTPLSFWVGHSRLQALGLGTPGRLWGWHWRETLGLVLGTSGILLDTAGSFWAWALKHSRETGVGLHVGWAGVALQENSGAGHSREWGGHCNKTLALRVGHLWLGTPGSFWGWALQGASGSRPGEEMSSGRGEELSLKSNNPTKNKPSLRE